MPLSAQDIRTAFAALSDELARRRERAEITVVGGAALILLFGTRESTKDVDAYFVSPDAATIREAAERVADHLGLPRDWLNDGAKAYLVGLTTGRLLFESPSLIARAASTPQLLGMKLAAWRDAIDRDDARSLLFQMTGSAKDIWEQVRLFVPLHQLDKASYAFDDLWDALHGPS
jgi:hypothetical protein